MVRRHNLCQLTMGQDFSFQSFGKHEQHQEKSNFQIVLELILQLVIINETKIIMIYDEMNKLSIWAAVLSDDKRARQTYGT